MDTFEMIIAWVFLIASTAFMVVFIPLFILHLWKSEMMERTYRRMKEIKDDPKNSFFSLDELKSKFPSLDFTKVQVTPYPNFLYDNRVNKIVEEFRKDSSDVTYESCTTFSVANYDDINRYDKIILCSLKNNYPYPRMVLK